eukprot:178588-Alexandrium_andersonii.AAC.1
MPRLAGSSRSPHDVHICPRKGILHVPLKQGSVDHALGQRHGQWGPRVLQDHLRDKVVRHLAKRILPVCS